MSDQTIDSVEKTGFQALPAQTTADDAYARTPPGQAIVVLEAPAGRPLGVIPPARVNTLAGSTLALAEHRALWRPPTIVLPSTPVTDVLQAMLGDKSIRWQVILRGPEVIGLVSPDDLFALSRRATPTGDLLLAESVYGDPLTKPSGLCYQCTTEPEHHFAPERVEKRNADGQALCPCDGSVMHGTFDCPKELSRC
jgi:hypothetical protein